MNESLPPEKVFRVLELIAERPRVSQRELAKRTGFSLGLINLTLKRLVKTGHIKASALNRRKLEYLLTAKGLFEQTNRTTDYINRTLATFSAYKKHVDGLMRELVAEGHTSFALLGRGEVSSLVELFLTQTGAGLTHRYIDEGASTRPGEVVLDCRLRRDPGAVGISILERLLQVRTPAVQQSLEVVGNE